MINAGTCGENGGRGKSRDELILEHLPQVKLIANRIHARVPPWVSLEDLISTGIVGLIAAIDRYDPKQAVKLKTFAEYKIRGAILDSLRSLDWAPRQHRKRARQIGSAITLLEQKFGRVPTENEVAEYLQIPVAEYQTWVADTRNLTVASLEHRREEDDGIDPLQFVSDAEENWPSQIFEDAELRRLFGEILEKMPVLERTILWQHFYEDRKLRDIAKACDLHESRISQLKTQALARLKNSLAKHWPQERGARNPLPPSAPDALRCGGQGR